MKALFVGGVVLLFASVALAGHSFKGTDVLEYDQTNFAQETGIGFGKRKIKGDFFVMFYASWCPHCQKFMPTWLQMKEKHPSDNIIAVHCPDNHDLCEAFNIQGYPTLLLFSKEKYQYCQFTDRREYDVVNKYWEDKCSDATMRDISFRVDSDYSDDDPDVEQENMIDLGGEVIHKDHQEDPDLDEEEKKKDIKSFRAQKNRAYEDKIMKFKDYLKKLGPLTIVTLIALCIISVTFICNKCCSYDQEDPFTKRVTKSIEKKSKAGYSKQNDRSSYVL